MKRLILLLTGIAMASFIFAGTPVLTLHKTQKVCIPDGVGNTDGTEPWISTWIPMTCKPTSNTVDEMASNFQLAFNDSYLWVLAQQKGNATTDTGVIAIPNSWERDNFEVFISLDTTSWKYNGRYGEANNIFRMQRSADNNYPWGFDDSQSIGANNKNFKIGQVDAGDGSFVQEWQIPWMALTSAMVDSGKFDGKYIKFDIQATDNTTDMPGGNNDRLFWASNTGLQEKNTEYLGLIGIAPTCAKSTKIGANGVSWQPDCIGPFAKNEIYIAHNEKIFPNPASEYLNISNDGDLKSISIKNIIGEELIQKDVNNEEIITVQLNNLTNSIYFVTLTYKSGSSSTVKFVKK
jgi:hypothetical protein